MPPRLMPMAMLAIFGVIILWVTKYRGPTENIKTLPFRTGAEILRQAEPEQVLFLNFWATWCEPCTREIPVIVELAKKWSEKGVKTLLVNVETSTPPEDTTAFLQSLKAAHLGVIKAENPGFFSDLGIDAPHGLPYSALIRKNPPKIKTWFGEKTSAELELEITEFLK